MNKIVQVFMNDTRVPLITPIVRHPVYMYSFLVASPTSSSTKRPQIHLPTHRTNHIRLGNDADRFSFPSFLPSFLSTKLSLYQATTIYAYIYANPVLENRSTINVRT